MKKEIKNILKKHKDWLEGESDGERADLRDANLQGADLDFSCFPLWCGGLDIHLDDRQLIQIAYHLVRNGLHSKNASEETKKELAKLIDFANRFHRVNECGEADEKSTGSNRL